MAFVLFPQDLAARMEMYFLQVLSIEPGTLQTLNTCSMLFVLLLLLVLYPRGWQ